MMALSVRWRTKAGLSLSLAAALLALVMTAPAARSQSAGESDVLTVVLDRAQLMKMPGRIATIVVGNPLIADITLQPSGNAVLTGKGYGETNLMALDRNGEVLLEKIVRVEAPKEVVFVYRGADRHSYSCTPTCEPQIMLGDADGAFKTTLGQSLARNGAAQAAAR